MRSFLDELDSTLRELKSGLEELISTVKPWARSHLARDTREPAADMRDTGKELVIAMELPGIHKENIELHVSERGVEVRAEVQEELEEGEYHLRERTYRSLYRRLTLPEAVDPERTEATFRDGVLEIRMPKVKPRPLPKGRRVEIK